MSRNAAKPDVKVIASNKKARHDYFIEETFEAGVELTGCEVRSLRENHCQLVDCYVLVRQGQAWLHGLHISPYSHGTYNNPDPDRKRRLLMHKKQIRYLGDKAKLAGMALVPLSIYFNDAGRVKVELGLCKGRKLHDKRAQSAERESRREISRALKRDISQMRDRSQRG